jgi:hypothetical protein
MRSSLREPRGLSRTGVALSLTVYLGLLWPSRAFPPNLGIVGTIEDLRELLLDFAQTRGAQLERRLIDCGMSALFRQPGVEVAQISDFLAKAGEMFRDIWHPFDHTPYLVNLR